MTKVVRDIRSVLQENRIFFGTMLVFLFFGGILLLWIGKGDVVLFFSAHRSRGGDLFFILVDKLGEGIAFIPALIFLLFIRYRFAATIPALGFSVLVLTQSVKSFFSHPRPIPYFQVLNLMSQLVPVDGVEVNEGWNSFPSGHTMTAFALYTFMALCLPYKKWGGMLFFILALLAGLARIYLMQHFFQDVYLGALLGTLLALFWYMASYRLWPEPHFRMDQRLSFSKKMERS